ncbi:MAG: penicillin-binding protein 2 [bacterium]|nr:penicillin-binding protein 2 [bacterium]
MPFSSRDIPNEFVTRIAVAGGVVLLVFACIFARLWFLQVAKGAEMRIVSEQNRIRLVRVPAARGVVYDRNGEILVDNRPSFDVVFVPEDAPDRRAVLRTLATQLAEPEQAVLERFKAPSKRPPYEGIVLRRDLDWQGVVALETHQLELPGVTLQVGPRRFYPFGSLAAHVLGYVGEASERDLAESTSALRPGDIVGKANLERAWDAQLRGVPGGQQVEVDALGRRVQVLHEEPDVPGNTLTLTLDRELQEVAENALGDRAGAVVAIDPRDGEILVLASKPAYDPNVFARGILHSEWRALTQDPLRPLNDRAVQGQYPPGSTFKVAVAAGILERNLVSGRGGVHCSGGVPFGNHYFRCWRRGGHGGVGIHEAIVQSCDVFFYQFGQRLGVDGIAEYARKFGLGLPTGVELENEKPGIIPDTEWKQRRFKQPWFAGETLSVAIGQGYVTVTPLQLAHMTATIANGGTRYRPHYVKRIEAPDGSLVREVAPEVLSEAGVAPETIAEVKSAMRDVVMAPNGTGKKARVPGIEVAGKTGTAQVVKLADSNRKTRASRDHAWFIAFAPVERPEIAMAVLVEHAGGGGGANAAPIAQQVLQYYFERQGRVPAAPDAVPSRRVTQEAHAVRSPAPDAL